MIECYYSLSYHQYPLDLTHHLAPDFNSYPDMQRVHTSFTSSNFEQLGSGTLQVPEFM